MDGDRYDALILEELRSIKAEFLSIREELSTSANVCGQTRAEFSKNFTHTVTFWKVIGIVMILISGSYGYTTLLMKLL